MSIYTTEYDVLTKTGLTSEQLQEATNAVRANGFNDFQAFVDAENTYGISSLYLLAHACVESAWGTSEIAPNNIFGFNADDADPSGDASSYASQAACINAVADFLKVNYLTPGGKYFSGDTVSAIFVHYSTSGQTEAATVVDVMNLINEHVAATPAPAPAPTPEPVVSSSEYLVKEGDNLSTIAEAHGLTLAEIEDLNPQFAPDFNLIHVGDVVNIGTPTSSKTYTIKSGDTFWALEDKFGLPHGTLERLNPGVNPNDLKIGSVINV